MDRKRHNSLEFSDISRTTISRSETHDDDSTQGERSTSLYVESGWLNFVAWTFSNANYVDDVPDNRRESKIAEARSDHRNPTEHSYDDDVPERSLVHNAGHAGRYQDLGMACQLFTPWMASLNFDPEYADPTDVRGQNAVSEKASPLAALMGAGRYPLEQRIEDKKRGIGRQKYPFVGMFSVIFLLSVTDLRSVGIEYRHGWGLH
jgi:hypothetical protein